MYIDYGIRVRLTGTNLPMKLTSKCESHHFPWMLELTLRATSGGGVVFDEYRARLGTS